MIRFTLNGSEVTADGVDPHTTLLAFLRDSGLTGTKEGCAEGECGACAVALVRPGPDGEARYDAVNSCLLLLPAVDGHEVTTVEGIAGSGALHPVQQAMVERGGSQCGYCTPGFVVSLFTHYYRPGRDGYDPEAISGNLCRCTGYRPIRDAAASLPMPTLEDPFKERLRAMPPAPRSLRYRAGDRRFYRPAKLDEALTILRDEPQARITTGGTDLVVEANLRHSRFGVIVSLENVAELRRFERTPNAFEIGAALPLSDVEERLGGEVPMLDDLFPLFSSRLIRNRATLGGNLGNASPIGDAPPCLLALDAELRLAGPGGERIVPLDGFFTGYRKTVLAPGELIVSIKIPRPLPTLGRFYKVSKRILDDISTVAAALALDLDGERRVQKARLAYGGVAPTPVRAKAVEEWLTGKPWTLDTVQGAQARLGACFTPISDHRGSAAYRDAMVQSLLAKLFHETGNGR